MSQELRKKLAYNLKKQREAKKLNREELSLLLGFENSYVSKLERCSINITIDRLEKIGKYFEIEPFHLLK